MDYAAFCRPPGLRFNDSVHAFPSQLPDDLLGEKLAVLTEQIGAVFGARPTSYRAGRFGFDDRSAAFLAEAGYVVDSSVSPLWSWRRHAGLDGKGGPDFRGHLPRPFLLAEGERPLVEIPVTILPTYAALRRSSTLLAAYQTLPVRGVRKVLLVALAAPATDVAYPRSPSRPRRPCECLALRVAARTRLHSS